MSLGTDTAPHIVGSAVCRTNSFRGSVLTQGVAKTTWATAGYCVSPLFPSVLLHVSRKQPLAHYVRSSELKGAHIDTPHRSRQWFNSVPHVPTWVVEQAYNLEPRRVLYPFRQMGTLEVIIEDLPWGVKVLKTHSRSLRTMASPNPRKRLVPVLQRLAIQNYSFLASKTWPWCLPLLNQAPRSSSVIKARCLSCISRKLRTLP